LAIKAPAVEEAETQSPESLDAAKALVEGL
jgi:hypothetical protein